jgi:hypothetical protein
MTTYSVPRTCVTEGCRNPALSNNKRCPKCLNELQRTGWAEPTYAPLRVHTGRQPFNRIHSSKVDRS